MGTINRTRIGLHEKLCGILGSTNVYYDPPESIKLKYPCIIYHQTSGDHAYSGNKTYLYTPSYEITTISKDADDNFVERMVSEFEMIRHGSRYTAENLYHDTFTLYW